MPERSNSGSVVASDDFDAASIALARQVLSDCGVSDSNERLLVRVASRIFQYGSQQRERVQILNGQQEAPGHVQIGWLHRHPTDCLDPGGELVPLRESLFPVDRSNGWTQEPVFIVQPPAKPKAEDASANAGANAGASADANKDSRRLEWVLRRCSGPWLRAYLGVANDTGDMAELRRLIDAHRGGRDGSGIAEDTPRLEWVLRRCAGPWLRAHLGVASDTGDMDELRALIDASRRTSVASADAPLQGGSRALAIVYVNTLQQIETELDAAGSPIRQEDGHWLSLPERIRALAARAALAP